MTWERATLRCNIRHLIRLGYKLKGVDNPHGFYAFHEINRELVDIIGSVHQTLIIFRSVWATSDYSVQNYNKFLYWVNTLNLDSGAVQFSINQLGALQMQLCYFGEYDSDAFDLFHHAWKEDIKKMYGCQKHVSTS